MTASLPPKGIFFFFLILKSIWSCGPGAAPSPPLQKELAEHLLKQRYGHTNDTSKHAVVLSYHAMGLLVKAGKEASRRTLSHKPQEKVEQEYLVSFGLRTTKRQC